MQHACDAPAAGFVVINASPPPPIIIHRDRSTEQIHNPLKQIGISEQRESSAEFLWHFANERECCRVHGQRQSPISAVTQIAPITSTAILINGFDEKTKPINFLPSPCDGTMMSYGKGLTFGFDDDWRKIKQNRTEEWMAETNGYGKKADRPDNSGRKANKNAQRQHCRWSRGIVEPAP